MGFSNCDEILSSRRLVGYAAIQRQRNEPTEQAPPLSEGQVLKLHEVLNGDSDTVDRAGAGCMLVCVYGRAGWSDLRFIHRAVLNLEHKDELFLSSGGSGGSAFRSLFPLAQSAHPPKSRSFAPPQGVADLVHINMYIYYILYIIYAKKQIRIVLLYAVWGGRWCSSQV